MVSHLDRRLREHILLYDISFSVTPTPKPAVRDEAWGVDRYRGELEGAPAPLGETVFRELQRGKNREDGFVVTCHTPPW